MNSFRKNRALAFLGLGLCLTEGAHAFTFTITNRTYPNGNQAAMDTLASQMENQFNNSIASSSNQENFLSSVGNANAVSTRSYLSPGVIPGNGNFFVNFGLGTAIAVGQGASLSNGISFPKNQLPPIGVAAKTGLSVGFPGRVMRPPGNLDPKRIQYVLSFFQTDLSRYIGRGVTMSTSQFSAGMVYQLYTSKPWSPLVRFNGIRLVSGLSYAAFDASYRTPFNLTQYDAGTNATMTWNSNVDLGVTSKVFSITNEATTGICFLWILNLYTGLGVDFNFGSSSITGGSSGPVTAASGATSYFTGTGTVSGDSKGVAPALAQIRFLLGTEVDLGSFGIYVQGQASTPSVYGLNFGAHFIF